MARKFLDDDFSGADFREVDFTGARMRGVILVDVDIDGLIRNMVVNGVDVVPLVQAELDRRHPELVLIRSSDPDELRLGWATLETQWDATTARIGALPEELRQQRVDDEWSAVETLRHLISVTDLWFRGVVLGEESPCHPWGLAASFIQDPGAMGLDVSASPSFDEILAVREQRQAMVREFLASATTDSLQALVAPVTGAGWPPPDPSRTVAQAIHVVLDEEWAHHRFCVRDLDALEATDG